MRQSIRLYAAVILLYPPRFRREFGDELKSTFRCWLDDEASRQGSRGILRAWRTVGVELVPTLLREHVDAAVQSVETFFRSRVFRGRLKVLLAAQLPLAGYIVLFRLAPRRGDVLVLTLWFALMAAGMAWARGRGWGCHWGAILGSLAAVGLVAGASALTETTTPSILVVAPLLAAAAATVALILATYVRLVMEGVRCSHRTVD